MYYKICDFHNDLPSILMNNDDYDISVKNEKFHTDIPRLQKGGVAVQFFAVCPCSEIFLNDPFNSSMKMIDKIKYAVNKSPETEFIGDAATMNNILEKNKIACILALEGGHALEDSLEKLEVFYEAGVRYLTITWNNSNNWAVSSMDERSRETGLSQFGKEVIRKMNKLGMMIDVSHTGIKTINDIFEITDQPVIASHTGARSLNNHPRNLTDSQIKNIAASGGVIGVVFYPPFLHATGYADIEAVINHIDYIASLVGVEYTALGSDFDGIGYNTVKGLDDVSKFPLVTEALSKRGFSSGEINKIVFQNTLNVFNKICG